MNPSFFMKGPLALSMFVSTAALAGGFDNSNQPSNMFYGLNNQVQVSVSHTSVDWSGTSVENGAKTGDLVPNDLDVFVGARLQLSEAIACTVTSDEPFETSTAYNDDSISAPDPSKGLSGKPAPLKSDINTAAMTLGCGYSFNVGPGRLTFVLGGKSQQFSGSFSTDGPTANLISTDQNLGDNDNWEIRLRGGTEFGYVVGFGYEIPDIALKANVTYHSGMDYDLSGTSYYSAAVATAFTQTPTPATTVEATSEVSAPDAVNVTLQTGIAPKWLAFADLRWARWSDVPGIKVKDSVRVTTLNLFDQDTLNYTVGIGHQLTEKVSLGVAYADVLKLGDDESDLPDGVDSSDLRQPIGDSYTVAVAGGYQATPTVHVGANLAYTQLEDAVVEDAYHRVEFEASPAITVAMKVTVNF